MWEPIVFYDIISNVKDKAWSPNTWKTRYCLNFKGLPYRTVWVEYPDIADVCKKIGAPPGSVIPGPNPTPLLTLPAIFDPNTNTAIAESMAIARYLDATYPDTPRLIPAEADALQAAFNGTFRSQAVIPLLMLCIVPSHSQLLPRSQVYFRKTREAWFGAKLEDMAPHGSAKRAEHFATVEKAFAAIAGWLNADGKDKPFLMGDQVSYGDIVIASFLVWTRIVLGEDSPEWRAVKGWSEGRWAKFMDAFKAYEAIDVGTDN